MSTCLFTTAVIVSPTLDNDPVGLEFVYTHDSAASVYLNISTTISDTQLIYTYIYIVVFGVVSY